MDRLEREPKRQRGESITTSALASTIFAGGKGKGTAQETQEAAAQ